MSSFIKYEVSDHIARIWIDRPDALNAMNSQLIRDLDATLDLVAADDRIRVLVIGGTKHFAAGADIKEMVNCDPKGAAEFCFTPTFNKVMNLKIPTIAAIGGYALGGGTELSMCCDMRIISENGIMGQPEINIGIMPGGGGCVRLPRIVGYSKAFEIITTGWNIPAAEALKIGLVNKVVPDDALLEEALKLAARIASRPLSAVVAAKATMKRSLEMDSVEDATLYERDRWAELFVTKDQKEGMNAFIEKRKPSFN